MKRIARLRKEARESATFRGHVMTKRWYLPCNEPARQVLRCTRCGKQVQIIMKPAPNEIEVGGEAVAVNCDSAREEIYNRTLQELTQDIEDIGKKTYLAPAISSHLRHFHPEITVEEANNLINTFFLREAERSV